MEKTSPKSNVADILDYIRLFAKHKQDCNQQGRDSCLYLESRSSKEIHKKEEVLMGIIKKSEVIFVNDKIKKEFNDLDENDELKKHINRAIDEIKNNAFCAIPIPKRLIPKEYIQKFGISNLWKYDLPDGWRLVYSITTPNKVEILAIILEWFSHPEYEKRFHY